MTYDTTSNIEMNSVTLTGSHNNVMDTQDSIIIGHNSSISNSTNIVSIGNEHGIIDTTNAIGIGHNLNNLQNQIVIGYWNAPSNSFFILANGTADNTQNIFEISGEGNIISTQINNIMNRIQILEDELVLLRNQTISNVSQCSCIDLQYSFQNKQCCVGA